MFHLSRFALQAISINSFGLVLANRPTTLDCPNPTPSKTSPPPPALVPDRHLLLPSFQISERERERERESIKRIRSLGFALREGDQFAIEEYRLARDVEEEVKKLRSTVALMKGVLRVAEEKRVTEESMIIWFADLKEILFDADDALDEAATCAALQTREVGITRSVTGVRAKVCNIFCCFGGMDKIVSGHDMGHLIGATRMKLDDIFKEKDSPGLRVLGGNSWQGESRSRGIDSSSMLAGRDEEKRKIIQHLLASGKMTEPPGCKSSVHVLAICGMGGIGKKILTKFVLSVLAYFSF